MATANQLAWLRSMVAPAQLSECKWGVLSSVTLAQCILESAWGQSQLARRSNNYFGIKALPGQEYVEFTTREVVSGRSMMELARFARYPSAIESFEAHARLLATSPRYADAMAVADEPMEFARRLGHCGYSTEPGYSYRLRQLIVEHDLWRYDTPPTDQPPTDKEAA